MFNFKNISNFKTTSIGIVLMLLSAGFQLYLFSKADYSINYYTIGLMVSGLAFLFAPDDAISLLKSIINKKTKENG